MRYVSAFALLLCASLVGAAPPILTGPDKVYGEVGDWVEVKIETVEKSVKFVALKDGLKKFPADKLKDPKAAMFSATVPGKYDVLCYTGNADGPSEPFVVTLVFGTGPYVRPVPPMPPDPVPPVPPVPPTPLPVVVAEPWVIVVEETSARTPAITKVLSDLKFWEGLPVEGWGFYDKDSTDAKKYKYDVKARETGTPLPVLMIFDGKGNLIKSSALPATTADVRKFVKDYTGK